MLIIGLGNYGDRYKFHRHNVGFMMVDALASHLSGKFVLNKKFMGILAIINANNIFPASNEVHSFKNIILFKPHTYMNLSGEAVQSISNFYRIQMEEILVIHDDLDLPLGKVIIKHGGGSGGHNGIKSISSFIGDNYSRLKIGIGRPNTKDRVPEYVLTDFSEVEMILINKIRDKIINNFEFILNRNWSLFMNSVLHS